MVVAAILAAGSGQRFGKDKTRVLLGGKPVWRWSYDVFAAHPLIDRVILVASPSNYDELSAVGETILGGESRQASTLAAARACGKGNRLLVHDAARPFVSADLIERVVAAKEVAVAPSLPVTDSIKQVNGTGARTLDRSQLVAVQTPQAVLDAEYLIDALTNATEIFPDEVSVMESQMAPVTLVDGDVRNFKITNVNDLDRANGMLQLMETRSGIGYDIHPFSPDPDRKLWLGGVCFEDHRALDGHSDADVLLHAITDALLGAAALGDIGVHFPNTDPEWAGASSLGFLGAAANLLLGNGWTIVNIDATVIAETPKVMKRANDIRAAIATAVDLSIDRVSIKATTNEGLGSIGRSEGIAAFATATIRR